MEMFNTVVIILSFCFLLFVLRKQILINEILLEQNIEYKDMFDNINVIIDDIGEKLIELDYKGSFSSDDEIGWFFKDIIKLYEILKNYKILE